MPLLPLDVETSLPRGSAGDKEASVEVETEHTPIYTTRVVPVSQEHNNSNTVIPWTQCRHYRMLFNGPHYGIQVVIYEGQVVITKILDERLCRLGRSSKPSIGDVLVKINGQRAFLSWIV